jgi:hypothetical protein
MNAQRLSVDLDAQLIAAAPLSYNCSAAGTDI